MHLDNLKDDSIVREHIENQLRKGTIGNCRMLYLHNLAIRWRDPDFEEDDYPEAEDDDCDEELPPNYLNRGDNML